MSKNLNDLKIYNQAMEIGEKVWQDVTSWNYLEKDTVGKQLIRAVDSIAANLSEGYGRYHFKEEKNFAYYSRGSLYETKTWLTKAKNRNLISEQRFSEYSDSLTILVIMLNNYIKTIGPKPDSNEINEPIEPYGLNDI
ncbi:MAG: four helix bundle protein [Cyclobacteriaceae bacterium]|jgi:four helix bundle protein|nr:four helix bundle protein [Flammeovirgaceae bacterium]